jgi:SAM-dependent methyltransferase
MSNHEYLTSIYSLTGEMPHRVHLEIYSLLRLVGDLTGKSVLDAACGHGLFSRVLKQSGAASVLGVDLSESLVGFARQIEQGNPLGIEYQVDDITSPRVVGTFDVVTAAWLFPYASSPEQLGAMATSLHAKLVPGGRIVGIIANPGLDLSHGNYTRYGMTVNAPDARPDGTEYTVDLHLDPPFSIGGRFWTPPTIDSALAAAGFHDIAWSRPQCSREGMEQLGAEHWAPLLENPNMLFFTARG